MTLVSIISFVTVLRSLRIQHFALIRDLDLEFGPGLTIMTGETGAGKSIIIDALLAVFGERTSSDVIQRGEQRAVIEAHIELDDHSPLHAILLAHDCEQSGNSVIIRREISAKGTSRYFVNDSPTQAAVVRELGSRLVDVHGQFEHQSILKPEFQMRMVDESAQSVDLRLEFQQLLTEVREAESRFQHVVRREQELLEKQEYQRHQLEELRRIDPQPLEDVELEQELSLLSHAEERSMHSRSVYELLYGAQDSARDRLLETREHLQALCEIDPNLSDQMADLSSALISVDELAKTMKQYADGVEFSPERTEQLRERLQVVHRLRKRYGSLERCIELRQTLEQELQFIENVESEKSILQSHISDLQQRLGALGMKLSRKRHAALNTLCQGIEGYLKELGLEHAQCSIDFEQKKTDLNLRSTNRGADDSSGRTIAIHQKQAYEVFANGLDLVRFRASMNKGEEPMPLDKVLSGGEASRLMLALKSVLANADEIPVVVFDEIDTGVSGRIARKVGQVLHRLGETHQVIVITHQAQIASMGSHHIAISKLVDSGQTFVQAAVLSARERVNEVAKLISGEHVTTSTLKSAKELLAETV